MKGLFEFAFDHCDNCPLCSRAEFCDEGKALIKRAAEIGAECLVPDVAIKTPSAKA